MSSGRGGAIARFDLGARSAFAFVGNVAER